MEIRSIGLERGYAYVSARSDDRAHRDARERFLEALARSGVPIEMLQFAPGRVGFACAQSHVRAVLDLASACAFTANVVSPCVKLVLQGDDIARTSGVMSAIVRTFRVRSVELLHFADGASAISLIVKERQADHAERAMRELLAPATGNRPIGTFSFDDRRGIVLVDGRCVRLGARQASLLRYLLANAGEAVTAEQIASDVFSGTAKDLAAVRVHVHNLRKKVERDPFVPRYVITVPNRGYRLAV